MNAQPSANRQTVIVTGASRGLGAAAARILAEIGARVVITARSAQELDALAAEIRAAGGEAIALAGDISAPETAEQLVHAALDHFGRLDAVINNAGILDPLARIEGAVSSEWSRNLHVNVIGPVLLVRAALPHLRETQGRVINVSSGAAVKAKAGWGAYCVAKAALNQFNAVLALEEPQITALAVRPGVIDTAMQAVIRDNGADAMDPGEYERFKNYHLRDDLAPPEKPGRALALLALYAPREWSGEFMQWDEDRVAALEP